MADARALAQNLRWPLGDSVIMVLTMVATSRALLKENRVREREEQRWLAEQVAAHIDENDLRGTGRTQAVDSRQRVRFWPSRH